MDMIRNNWLVKFLVLMVMLAVPAGLMAAGLTGDEILSKVDGVFEAQSTIMEATMTTVDVKGVSKSSQMIIYVKKDGDGKTRTLIHYLSPAIDKGTKFLSLGNVDQMWMYLPKVEKTIRIAGSMIKQSMMNSDFSYEDLMDRSNFSDYYTAQVLGNEAINGENCYVLELKAKKGSAHYRQLKLWVRQDNFIPAKEEFYSGGGKLTKVSTQSEITTMDDRQVPTKITFQDLGQKGHQTLLAIKNMRFKADIPERYFSMQFLEKGQ
jgi:outer membrane lipoprotein-sorting protein